MNPQRNVPAVATWLWYLDRDVGGIALDASDTAGQLAAELSPHFSQVHVLRNSRSALDEIQAHGARVGNRPYAETLGTVLTAPWGDHSFDCVAVHDRFAGHDPKGVETVEALSRIRTLLKPGGWFIGASPNASYRRYRTIGSVGVSPTAFLRMLAKARFREARCVFAIPSIDNPVTLIPDAPGTIKAYESFDSIQGATRWTRRVITALGLRAVLYPAYFVLARS